MGLYDATFHPLDSRIVATAGQEGKVFVWRRRDGPRWRETPALWINGLDLREIDFSPDGKYLVVASEDATARVLRWPEGAPLLQLLGRRGALTTAGLSRDGRFVVTGSLDGTVRVWRNEPPVSEAFLANLGQSAAPGISSLILAIICQPLQTPSPSIWRLDRRSHSSDCAIS